MLVIANGAYGERQVKMCQMAGIDYTRLGYSDNQRVQVEDVRQALIDDSSITHVSMIHSETTSGLINLIGEVGNMVK